MSQINIFQLKQEINKLLEERPDLIPLQLEIDQMLKSAGNQHNRCVLLSELMKDKMQELSEQLELLKSNMISYGSELVQISKIEKSDTD